jgi:hypothetical protein
MPLEQHGFWYHAPDKNSDGDGDDDESFILVDDCRSKENPSAPVVEIFDDYAIKR